jgi:hypothetical protein
LLLPAAYALAVLSFTPTHVYYRQMFKEEDSKTGKALFAAL